MFNIFNYLLQNIDFNNKYWNPLLNLKTNPYPNKYDGCLALQRISAPYSLTWIIDIISGLELQREKKPLKSDNANDDVVYTYNVVC